MFLFPLPKISTFFLCFYVKLPLPLSKYNLPLPATLTLFALAIPHTCAIGFRQWLEGGGGVKRVASY